MRRRISSAATPKMPAPNRRPRMMKRWVDKSWFIDGFGAPCLRGRAEIHFLQETLMQHALSFQIFRNFRFPFEQLSLSVTGPQIVGIRHR
jgi:hypothetical protein